MFKRLFKGKKVTPPPPKPKELSEITKNLLDLSRQYEEAQRKNEGKIEREIGSPQSLCV